MRNKPTIRKIQCKSAIGKCGFPGGGLAVNPYVGCGHDCQYCYARFMRRFTGHDQEQWGTFVDVRENIAEVLEKQLANKYKNKKRNAQWIRQVIYVGTVTDPYQPIEKEYELTQKVLKVLANYENPISLLTKADLVLRDLDILKQIREIDINVTINTVDEKWANLIEPNAPSIERRFTAIQKLSEAGITVYLMMGPYWPFFTDTEAIFQKAKATGVKKIFSESFNTTGGNWTGVAEILQRQYPDLLLSIKDVFFDPYKFQLFHFDAQQKLEAFSKKYNISVNIFFGLGHAGKFGKDQNENSRYQR
jgi:DNA repair photolyase